MAPTDPRSCTSCGTHVPEGHTHCGQCGARFDGKPVQRTTQVFSPLMHPGQVRLTWVHGPEGAVLGASWYLQAESQVVGRRQGEILLPDDPTVSPEHCELVVRDKKVFLRDRGSLNGTYLRLRSPTEIKGGDLLMIGQQVVRVEALSLSQEFPMRDGTLMYVSPPRPYRFRVVQLLPEERVGQVYASPHNEVILGREGCDMSFERDPNVSRRHAKITWEGGRLVVTDLESVNGTYLRLRGERQLSHGDCIMLGGNILRVELGAA